MRPNEWIGHQDIRAMLTTRRFGRHLRASIAPAHFVKRTSRWLLSRLMSAEWPWPFLAPRDRCDAPEPTRQSSRRNSSGR